jgi:hypothetical protein
MIEKLAEAILLSAKLHEESWQDYRYRLDLKSSTLQAIEALKLDNSYYDPILLLLRYSWEDALQWANKKMERDKNFTPMNAELLYNELKQGKHI